MINVRISRPGLHMLAADTCHRLLTMCANESQRERQGFEPFNPLFQRHDIVVNFAQILGTSFDGSAAFRPEQLPEGGLSTCGNKRNNKNSYFRRKVEISHRRCGS